MRTTRAPSATSFWMVGSAARMRVSSVTTPSFTGTLKSTRTSTRLPAASSPSMDLMSAMNAPQVVLFAEQVDASKQREAMRCPRLAGRRGQRVLRVRESAASCEDRVPQRPAASSKPAGRQTGGTEG